MQNLSPLYKLNFKIILLTAVTILLSSCFLQREPKINIYNGFEVTSIENKDFEQVWMTKNLNLDTFRNGDFIPIAKNAEEWKTASDNKTPSACYYMFDEKFSTTDGLLYNWYAVSDLRGLAPEGFKIPEFSDWELLIIILGGYEKAGIKMKAEGYNYTNESGFTGYLSGRANQLLRTYNVDVFQHRGTFGFWWSSTSANNALAWDFNLNVGNGAKAELNYQSGFKGQGYSVRCIKK